MIERLDDLVNDITSLNSKLVLLIGPPQSGKSELLSGFSERRNASILNVGATLGRKLLAIPSTRRHLLATDMLKDLADKAAQNDLLLLDNIELLFDQALQLNPLEVLKRHAHARRVVAVWPGQLQEDRLSYATTGHAEHQDYAVDGVVPFKVR